MPLSFVKKAFSGFSEQSEDQETRTIRGSCRIYVDGDKIRVECDDNTRLTIPSVIPRAGCVVYVTEDGKIRMECDKDISKILEKLRR